MKTPTRERQHITCSSSLIFYPPTNQSLLRYDNYLSEADKSLSLPSQPVSQANRNLGYNNLGMGLLNMADDSDSDDDSEDEAKQGRRRVAAAVGSSPSKHVALAAAT